MPLYRPTSILCSCKYECSGIVNPQQKPLVGGVSNRHIGNNDKKENNKIIILTGGRITRRCFKITTARAASSSGSSGSLATVTGLTATAAAIMLSVMGTNAVELLNQQPPPETLSDIPQMLSSECSSSAPGQEDCKKKARIQRPKSKQAESCTVKCVATCIRGGLGSPGEGPLNVIRDGMRPLCFQVWGLVCGPCRGGLSSLSGIIIQLKVGIAKGNKKYSDDSNLVYG